MIRIAVVVGCLVACGGSPRHVPPAPPAPAPAPYDVAPLAAAIHGELLDMAKAIDGAAGDCKAMAAALRPVFARMRESVDVAKRERIDDDVAKRLTTELHRYDADAARLTAEITAGFERCQADPDLRAVMVTMPTL